MSLVLCHAAWPEADREMWTRLFAKGDLLDGQGPLAHVRETTKESLLPRYGRWLAWLTAHHPALLTEPPCDRARLDMVRAWLADLDHTAPMTRLAFVDGLFRVLSAAEPARDWSAHRALKARLKRRAGRGEQTRKHGRILSSAVLLDAGRALALERADAAVSPIYRATRIRNGAMIALLALMPIRRRALANLRLGASVFVTEGDVTIALPAELTKSGRPWEAGVPQPATEPLLRYLNEARPALLARGAPAERCLWIAQKGRPLAEGSVGPTIAVAVWRMTGVRVPPHFFRDAAATTLARHSSQSATLIRPILAHTSDKTAERHYNHARTIEAGRDYAALLASMKGGYTR